MLLFLKDTGINFEIEKIYNENNELFSIPNALVITFKQYKVAISVFKDRNAFLYIESSSKANFKWFSDIPRAMQLYVILTKNFVIF